jgi:hypothetical protein
MTSIFISYTSQIVEEYIRIFRLLQLLQVLLLSHIALNTLLLKVSHRDVGLNQEDIVPHPSLQT